MTMASHGSAGVGGLSSAPPPSANSIEWNGFRSREMWERSQTSAFCSTVSSVKSSASVSSVENLRSSVQRMARKASVPSAHSGKEPISSFWGSGNGDDRLHRSEIGQLRRTSRVSRSMPLVESSLFLSGNVDDLGSSTAPHENNNSLGSSQFIEDIVVLGRPNSLDSIEGLADKGDDEEISKLKTEQGRNSSLDSIEGVTAAASGAADPPSEGKNTTNNSWKRLDPQEQKSINKPPVSVEDNAEWRNVFPSYMQSKENDVEQDPEEDTVNGETAVDDDPRRVSRTAGATEAAFAAVASVKEFDSQFGSQLLSSASPVFISGRSNGGPCPNDPGNLEDLISHDPIWAAIRAEARLEAEREPLLSSFLYASILAHSCFERSLGFVLANRLKNATLLATQLLDIFDEVFLHDVYIRQAIRLDVQAVKDRDPSCRSYSLALLYLKGYHALQAYRIAHALWTRGQRVLAFALQSRISEVFAVDIHPAARLGKAILLDHGTGVVIGETAVVGDRVSMLQGVTLGGTGKMTGDRHPKIKEGVLIGAGATILGNITVGRGAMVASGSLVLKDVPAHSMVAGTPARVVGYLEESTPSLTMKQDATKGFCQEYQVQHQALLESRLEGGAGI